MLDLLLLDDVTSDHLLLEDTSGSRLALSDGAVYAGVEDEQLTWDTTVRW